MDGCQCNRQTLDVLRNTYCGECNTTSDGNSVGASTWQWQMCYWLFEISIIVPMAAGIAVKLRD